MPLPWFDANKLYKALPQPPPFTRQRHARTPPLSGQLFHETKTRTRDERVETVSKEGFCNLTWDPKALLSRSFVGVESTGKLLVIQMLGKFPNLS